MEYKKVDEKLVLSQKCDNDCSVVNMIEESAMDTLSKLPDLSIKIDQKSRKSEGSYMYSFTSACASLGKRKFTMSVVDSNEHKDRE